MICVPIAALVIHLRAALAAVEQPGQRIRFSSAVAAPDRPAAVSYTHLDVYKRQKVRPAYRASNVLLKIARNGKSPVPRSIRSTGLKLSLIHI